MKALNIHSVILGNQEYKKRIEYNIKKEFHATYNKLTRNSEGGRVTSGIRTHDIQNHNLTL